MKKGCFVKSIIFLTVLTAVLLYLINYKFNDMIINPGKNFVINRMTKEMEFVKASPEKDSLKELISNYVKSIKSIDKLSENKIDNFTDSLKIALRDSVINQSEYKHLYKILNQKVN